MLSKCKRRIFLNNSCWFVVFFSDIYCSFIRYYFLLVCTLGNMPSVADVLCLIPPLPVPEALLSQAILPVCCCLSLGSAWSWSALPVLGQEPSQRWSGAGVVLSDAQT